jgi:hypothetical protein
MRSSRTDVPHEGLPKMTGVNWLEISMPAKTCWRDDERGTELTIFERTANP